MTEAEWLACEDPKPMLKFFQDKAGDRKLRLFAVACCRRIEHLIPLALTENQPYCREAVLVAERFADGHAIAEELQTACANADRCLFPDAVQPFRDVCGSHED